jgi:hypothetical protein
VNILSQLPTLIGVMIGAALSFLTSSLASRSEWRRSVSVRWDERRLNNYIEYMNEAKALATTALRIVAGRGLFLGRDPESVVVPLSRDEGYQLLAQAEQRRTAKAEAVLMLGDTATIESMTTLTESLWRLVGLARSEAVDIGTWHGAYQNYHRARLDFYECARSSMGVPAARIPPGTYWAPSAPAAQGVKQGVPDNPG